MCFHFSNMMLLGFEAQKVVELRLIRLAWGDQDGGKEAILMVTEKINAAIEATGTLMTEVPSRRLSLAIGSMCSEHQTLDRDGLVPSPPATPSACGGMQSARPCRRAKALSVRTCRG